MKPMRVVILGSGRGSNAEAILAAQQAGLPLWRYLGGTDPAVRAYASGLDFHLDDGQFERFFAAAR